MHLISHSINCRFSGRHPYVTIFQHITISSHLCSISARLLSFIEMTSEYLNKGINVSAILRQLTLALLVLMVFTQNLQAIGKFQSHPKDGRFKQISSDSDKWYFFDNQNWYIKAPDKFQHMMGSYTLSRIGDQFMDKYLAGGVVLGLGLYKEYDDGLREGWSPRDLLMNVFGVVAGVINNEKYKFWMDWVDNSVVLKFSVCFH
jgi:hypothetical protein